MEPFHAAHVMMLGAWIGRKLTGDLRYDKLQPGRPAVLHLAKRLIAAAASGSPGRRRRWMG
jgi:hypothetical protein